MCAGNHHHRFIQFKITRRNVQVKNTPSSPYMESLFMHMLKLFMQVYGSVTELLDSVSESIYLHILPYALADILDSCALSSNVSRKRKRIKA